MEKAERAKALADICSMCEPFALGWRAERVGERILEIARCAALARSIPLEKRRCIARKGRDLLNELKELGGGGLSERALLDLEALAQGAVQRTGRGGDRRSGEHSAKAAMHRMIVRLYIEAKGEDGFSKDGPLVRFVAAVCGFLGVEAPTNDAIKAHAHDIRRSVKKTDGSELYRERAQGGPIKF